MLNLCWIEWWYQRFLKASYLCRNWSLTHLSTILYSKNYLRETSDLGINTTLHRKLLTSKPDKKLGLTIVIDSGQRSTIITRNRYIITLVHDLWRTREFLWLLYDTRLLWYIFAHDGTCCIILCRIISGSRTHLAQKLFWRSRHNHGVERLWPIPLHVALGRPN